MTRGTMLVVTGYLTWLEADLQASDLLPLYLIGLIFCLSVLRLLWSVRCDDSQRRDRHRMRITAVTAAALATVVSVQLLLYPVLPSGWRGGLRLVSIVMVLVVMVLLLRIVKSLANTVWS